MAKWGHHVLKTWSSTQATVALSSAEAELYALTKGASQALGLVTLLADLGVEVQAAVHTDARAAIGIVRRSGLGKLRHLNVRYLWLQDQVASGSMALHKVHGLINTADLVTKYLAQAAVTKHLDSLDMWVESGRAATAPTLSMLHHEAAHACPRPATVNHYHETTVDGRHHNHKTTVDGRHHNHETTVDGRDRCPVQADEWRLEATRAHHKPRRELFTPLRVAGAPPAKCLTPARLTEG